MVIEVDITKTLSSRGRSFTLQSRFSSNREFVVLFGPSGSGKTLTLQSIAGITTPDTGRIVCADRVLFDSAAGIDVRARHRGIGYVFQDYALFPHLTVAENVAFGLANTWPWGLPKGERRRVAGFLELFEISHLAKSLPAELSGGQRQRVALARALAPRPALLLLDEPFAALDMLLREKMRSELLDLQSRFRVPVVMITHDPEDVRVLAQTLVIYESGCARQASSPMELAERTGRSEAAIPFRLAEQFAC
jgi:molybdate transport system ATP-binding protein